MYSIFNSYLLKLTGTMAGLAFFSFALQAQEPVPADSVKAGQAEKVRMPYHVKGRVVDAVTGQGFAGARITTPNVNVSAMTDEKVSTRLVCPICGCLSMWMRRGIPVKWWLSRGGRR